MKRKTVIYARISRKDKVILSDNSISVENQIKFLNSYAKSNGFTVDTIFIDDGASGGDYSRPEYNKMLDEVISGKICTILVKDFSRIGRVFRKVYELIFDTLPFYNVRLISVSDNFDSFVNFNDNYVTINAFLSEFYLKEFKRKLKSVKDFNANTKHLNFYPKYGYNFDEDRREVIDVYSAFIVNKIYNLIAKNYSVSQVAKILNENNVLTRSNYQTKVLGLKPLHKITAKMWTSNMVYEIVSDIEYLGHSVNLKRRKSGSIILNNTHEKIIDNTLFLNAKKALELTYKRKPKLNHLGSILVDKKTNKKLLFSKTKGEYYLCIKGKKIYSLKHDFICEILVFELKRHINLFVCDYEKIKEKEHKLYIQNETKNLNVLLSNLIEDRFNNKISEQFFISKSAEIIEKINDLNNKPLLNCERLKSVANSNAFYSQNTLKKLIKTVYVDYKNNSFTLVINYEV